MTNLDVQTYQVLLQPIFALFSTVLLSGAAVSAATEILKFPQVKVPAERYPRTTSAIGSLVATLFAVLISPFHLAITSPVQVPAFAIGVWITASVLYNQIINRNKKK